MSPVRFPSTPRKVCLVLELLTRDVEVVDALAGCAHWSIDLLAWLADSLFNLCYDPKFITLIKEQGKFGEISAFLQKQNNVALHLVLCSSTRGLLVAVCRRLQHLEHLGNSVVGYWQKNGQRPGPDGKPHNGPLHRAYQRMQQITSSSVVNAGEFEKLLNNLGKEIRSTYSTALTAVVSKATNQPPPREGAATNKHFDAAMKTAQLQCELSMLLGVGIHPMFRAVLGPFFATHLKVFRASLDPSRLFFKDFSLLEVAADSAASLEQKRTSERYVDMFRKVAMSPTDVAGRDSGGEGFVAGVPVWSGQWRRCVRCASVMEDVVSQRPGFTYVLSQQRKCACGGSWGLLPKDSLLG